MGVMIDGQYRVDDPGPDTTEGGEFKRAAAKIRDWITVDGPSRRMPGGITFSWRGTARGRIGPCWPV